MFGCPSPSQLDGYARGELSGEERKSIEAHLEDCPTCYSALIDREIETVLPPEPSDPADPPSGPDRFVGPYRIVRELGRGAQGRVYLAEDTRLPRRVALKVFPSSFAASSDTLIRFRREAAALSRIDHRGICAVHDTGEVDGCPYLAMRYVEGQTLGEKIVRAADEKARGQTQDRERMIETLLVIEKVARALHVAHEAGLIHRDIKPSNIMITPEGEPVILDFGLVKDDGGAELTLTRSGEVAGTPAYMSPEQISAGGARVDHRSDVFSLGVTLYEALTLALPFDAPTTPGVFEQILRGAIRDPSRSNPRISRDLRVILQTALERDPHRRYQTAVAFAEDLRRFRCHETILARPAGPGLRVRRWAQRNPRVAISLVAAFLTLGAALAIALVFLEKLRAEGQIRAALLRREEGQRLAFQSSTVLQENPGQALLLAIEAAQRAPSVASNAALMGALEISRERARLFGHPSAVREGAFSADDTRVATAGWDGTARFWNAASGEIIAIARGHEATVETVEFHADGARCLTASRDGTARIWEVASGKELLRIDPRDGALRTARFSPDGKSALTIGDSSAALWNADSGARLFGLDAHSGRIYCARFSPDGARIATGSADKSVILWDARTGAVLSRFQQAESMIYDVGWSGDSRFLIAGCDLGDALVWETATGRLVSTLKGHTFGIYCVALTRDGSRAATGSEDFTARIWDTASGKELFVLPHEHKVIHLEVSRDGRRLVTASYDRIARVWDMNDGHLVAALKGHAAPLEHAAFSNDGEKVLTSSVDSTARVWSVSPAQPVPVIPARSEPGLLVALDPTWRRAAITGPTLENEARLLAIPTGALETRLKGHTGPIQHMEFSADGAKLLTASADATARIWDATNGAELGTVRGHKAPLTTARFSKDASQIVTGSEDGSARLWDCIAGAGRSLADEIDGAVVAASFSPDGKKVCYVGGSSPIYIAEAADGRVLLSLREESRNVRSAEWCPDSRRVISSALTTRATVWSPEDGHRIGVLVHPSRVGRARYSPDGRRIVTHCEDRVVRIWDAESLELLLQLKQDGYQSNAAWFDVDRGSIRVQYLRIDGHVARGTLILEYNLDLLGEALKWKPGQLTSDERAHFEVGGPEGRVDASSAAH